MTQPLFMGNGDHSAAACWKLVRDLVGLLEDLGGLQQPLHPESEAAAQELGPAEVLERSRWEDRAYDFLRDVSLVLGIKIRILP